MTDFDNIKQMLDKRNIKYIVTKGAHGDTIRVKDVFDNNEIGMFFEKDGTFRGILPPQVF